MTTVSSFAYGEETYRLALGSQPAHHNALENPLHRLCNYCHISYGLHFEDACARHASHTFNSSRIYILASGSLSRQTDALERLEAALGDKVAGKFVGMKSHTLWSEVVKAVNECRDLQVDLIVTLGGGSLTDAAKLMTMALANDVKEVDDLRRLPSVTNPHGDATREPTVPVISIPTSLSGGEYSNGAGSTEDATHEKHQFMPPTGKGGPKLVILDPELTITTPDATWLSSGIRSVDHCTECLCSLGSNPQSDASAERGLRQLLPGLLRCKKDRTDIEARFACQIGVIDALHAIFSNYVPLGGSHGIGHMLGPLGVGHGETSCILLPAVCKYNATHGANVERQQNALEVLWSIPEIQELAASAGLVRDSADLGDLIDAFVRALGLPRTLKEVGVGRDKLDKLAEHSLRDKWCESNPVPLTKKEQILEILETVVG